MVYHYNVKMVGSVHQLVETDTSEKQIFHAQTHATHSMPCKSKPLYTHWVIKLVLNDTRKELHEFSSLENVVNRVSSHCSLTPRSFQHKLLFLCQLIITEVVS